MRFSDYKRLNRSNIVGEKRESGVYKIFNKHYTFIYIGHSTSLRHRLKAIFYKRSDYDQVENKDKLHKQAKRYKTLYTSIDKARELEKKIKDEKEPRFNKL